jgi:Cofilin/tropomyosin-type actin-binding protein
MWDPGISGLCRSPDGAKIKDKMVFASSRDALRRSLVGIAVEIQGTDDSEVAYETGAGFFSSLASQLFHTILYQSWIKQSAETDCYAILPVGVHPSQPHVLVFACRSIKFLQKCCWK